MIRAHPRTSIWATNAAREQVVISVVEGIHFPIVILHEPRVEVWVVVWHIGVVGLRLGTITALSTLAARVSLVLQILQRRHKLLDDTC